MVVLHPSPHEKKCFTKPASVASTHDDSTDFKHPDADNSAAAALVSVSSNTSKCSRLPSNIEKLLLIDIEFAGDIALFDVGKTQGLRSILDNPDKEHLHGKKR